MVRNYSSVAAETQLAEVVGGSATLLKVSSVVGFPALVPFTLGVDVDTVYEELVTVTGVAGLNLTVLRGQDGTAGQAHQVGATVRHVVSARDLREPQEHMAATTAVHGLGAGSSVVGTNDTQVVKNKTVDASNTVAPGALAAGIDAGKVTVGTLSSARLPVETTVSRLRVTSDVDASESSTAHGLQVGPTAGSNLRVDGNEILALNNGAPAGLFLADNASVTVPTPTGAAHAATKGYVDSYGDTDWVELSAFAPTNYTGTRYYRVKAGWACFRITGTRTGGGNVSGVDLLVGTLNGIAPAVACYGQAYVGSNVQRAYIETTGEIHADPFSINAGQNFQVFVTWPVG